MRLARLPVAVAIVLSPTFARAEATITKTPQAAPTPGPVERAPVTTAPPATPVTVGSHVGPSPGPVERVPTPPGPRSRAVAIPIEILSPVGGAGCFYRGRYVAGTVVTVASLAAGGAMLWGVTHDDRDVTIINAVAYGVARAAGIYLAAEPIAAPAAPPPLPASLPPPPSGKTVGFFPRFSF